MAVGTLYAGPGTFGFVAWADFHRSPIQDEPGLVMFDLRDPLIYVDKSGKIWTVDRDFHSDLGSVPRFLWSLIPPHEWPSAFFLHDMVCKSKTIPRLIGDRLLLEALEASGASRKKRLAVYAGVRAYALANGLK